MSLLSFREFCEINKINEAKEYNIKEGDKILIDKIIMSKKSKSGETGNHISKNISKNVPLTVTYVEGDYFEGTQEGLGWKEGPFYGYFDELKKYNLVK
jgi:hypothetical protein